MRSFLRSIKVAKATHSSKRKARKAQENRDANMLIAAKMLAHEYPAGTSPHYIVYQMERSRKVDKCS